MKASWSNQTTPWSVHIPDPSQTRCNLSCGPYGNVHIAWSGTPSPKALGPPPDDRPDLQPTVRPGAHHPPEYALLLALLPALRAHTRAHVSHGTSLVNLRVAFCLGLADRSCCPVLPGHTVAQPDAVAWFHTLQPHRPPAEQANAEPLIGGNG